MEDIPVTPSHIYFFILFVPELVQIWAKCLEEANPEALTSLSQTNKPQHFLTSRILVYNNPTV